MEQDRRPALRTPVTARARSPNRRRRIRRAAVVVLLLAVPIAAVASLTATSLVAREHERADSRLVASLDAAGAELAVTLSAAAADAGGLARAPAVRRAVIRRDAAALARLARTFPGLVVYVHGRRLTAPLQGHVYVQTAAVEAGGRRVGRIGIATRFDRALLLGLRRRAGVPLLLERAGRVTAGVGVEAGGIIKLSGLGPQTVTVANDRHRAVAAPLPGGDGRLVALVAAEVIEVAADRHLRTVTLAAILTLFFLVLAADLLSAILRRRRG